MFRHCAKSCMFALAASLAACTLPVSADDCKTIADDDARLSCLNRALYGDVLEGSAIGALGGAALGGGLGALAGGPRGAMYGAAGGAVGGGIAGGAVAYFNYNRERSGGSPDRMREFALSDVQAENWKLQAIVDEYRNRSAKSEEQVAQLQMELQGVRNEPGQAGDLLDRSQHLLTRAESDRDMLTKTVQAENQRIEDFLKYAKGTREQVVVEELGNVEKAYAALQEYVRQKDLEVAQLESTNASLEAQRDDLLRGRPQTRPLPARTN